MCQFKRKRNVHNVLCRLVRGPSCGHFGRFGCWDRSWISADEDMIVRILGILGRFKEHQLSIEQSNLFQSRTPPHSADPEDCQYKLTSLVYS